METELHSTRAELVGWIWKRVDIFHECSANYDLFSAPTEWKRIRIIQLSDFAIKLEFDGGACSLEKTVFLQTFV